MSRDIIFQTLITLALLQLVNCLLHDPEMSRELIFDKLVTPAGTCVTL